MVLDRPGKNDPLLGLRLIRRETNGEEKRRRRRSKAIPGRRKIQKIITNEIKEKKENPYHCHIESRKRPETGIIKR